MFDYTHFLCKKIIQENPYFIEAYIKLSELAKMRGNKTKANEYIKLAIEKNFIEEKEKKIRNYYFPRVAKWNKKDNRFYFFDNGCGWSINYAKKYLKRKDRRFWNLYSGFTGGKIRRYLIDKFELDGFKKEICNCEDGLKGVTFTLIEK